MSESEITGQRSFGTSGRGELRTRAGRDAFSEHLWLYALAVEHPDRPLQRLRLIPGAERVLIYGLSVTTLPDHPLRPPLAGATSIRRDTMTPSGGVGGSDPYFLREDHLDKLDIEYAVLSSIQAGKLVALPNAGEAVVLARAFNDYFIDKWLSVDERFRLAMCVAAHNPIEAAKEIRRIRVRRLWSE